jgi:hypothetical protein
MNKRTRRRPRRLHCEVKEEILVRRFASTIVTVSLLVATSQAAMASPATPAATAVTPAAAPAPHVVSSADLQAAIAHRLSQNAAERADIQALLSRPQVQRWASEAGLDLERAKATAASLEGESLQRAAAQARIADAQLAGGDALVIGTTTIVIVLLIIIIVLVA